MARVIVEREDVIPMLAEVFRTYGFEGASLARISQGTGLGKGSLYNFFPRGKEQMAEAVLAQVDEWFRLHVFESLAQRSDAVEGIEAMFDDVGRYFHSGRRVCLVGAFTFNNDHGRFTSQVSGYFAAWVDALAAALVRAGRDPQHAGALAKETVGGIQGALVLARGLGEEQVFTDTLKSLRSRLLCA